ncbi:hypothetical protein [Mammaliicoccus vitulinus]|uniref:hypothetical protein n=1 Tax=Mammaliicoccus vitulinus TaxID=71237 RepID=UPI00248C2845|nr:hypothetical protein [Mammaliicoccus vitulinus]
MHSPIIYIIEKGTEYVESLGGQLPDENQLFEETLLDCIEESDWLVANTIEYSSWHRNQWDESFEDMFKANSYYNFKVTEKGIMELSILHHNLINWDKRLLELHEEYNELLKNNLKENKFTSAFPYRDIKNYFEYKDMVEKESGGIKFVLYQDYAGELEFYGVFNTRDLVEHAKRTFEFKNTNTIEFQICTNVVGDYHF